MILVCNQAAVCGRPCFYAKPNDFAKHITPESSKWQCRYAASEAALVPPGTQPAPTPNAGPAIVDLVKADLDKRRALGIQKYGTALQAGNGRDALQDAYEEALDLCQYLKQAIEERNQKEVPHE